MALAPAAAPRHDQYPGLHVGVMGMYIFLASEVMFFGSLFAGYFYFFGSHPFGWPPRGTDAVQWFPLPTVNTVVLLSSGVTCHFGLDALRHDGRLGRPGLYGVGLMAVAVVAVLIFGVVSLVSGDLFAAVLSLFTAVVCGIAAAAIVGAGPFRGRLVFYGLWVATILLGAAFEIGQAYEFLTAHINLTTNEFASLFFTMTGFHGAHVFGGLVLLSLILGRSVRGQFNARHHVGPAAITLYWHFVDVVWLALYAILYIAVTAPAGG